MSERQKNVLMTHCTNDYENKLRRVLHNLFMLKISDFRKAQTEYVKEI